MSVAEWIEPGGVYTTRDGTRAEVAYTDMFGVWAVTGRILTNEGWKMAEWLASGAFDTEPHPSDLMPLIKVSDAAEKAYISASRNPDSIRKGLAAAFAVMLAERDIQP